MLAASDFQLNDDSRLMSLDQNEGAQQMLYGGAEGQDAGGETGGAYSLGSSKN